MTFVLRRVRQFLWQATRGPREKILLRVRAQVARALAENFSQLNEHLERLKRTGDELAAEIRSAEARHCEAELRHQKAQSHAEMSSRAAAEHYHETITRYEQTLGEHQKSARAVEERCREAITRYEQMLGERQESARAVEERSREAIARYERTLADCQQKLGGYHQLASESNLMAEGMVREMVRLQQHVEELSEAVTLMSDAMHLETETAPVTLEYRAAA